MSAGHDAAARDGTPSRVERGTTAGRAAPTAAEVGRGDWTARLLAVTQALNGAGGPTVALGEAFGRVAAALGATSAMVAVLDGAWLAFRPDLYSLRALDPTWPSRVRLADPTSFSAVAAVSGRPVWIPSPESLVKRYPAAVRSADEKAWAAIPIRVDGLALGVLRLAWAAPQSFSAAQQAFLRATADHAGHVLHRVQLLERERSLRQAAETASARTAELLALARGLANARRPAQVGEVLAACRYGVLGAVTGVVGLIDEDARAMRWLDAPSGDGGARGDGGAGGPGRNLLPLDSRLPFVRAAVIRSAQLYSYDEVKELSPEYAAWMESVGSRWTLSAPLFDEDRLIGSLTVLLASPEVREESLRQVQAVAALVGQALGRATAQDRAQSAVAELQRALLPSHLPDAPGAHVRAGYRASSRAGEIGGDFYDAVALPGGGVLLLLGDVQGHDLTASAIMAQLRAVLHCLAAEGWPPAELLARADQFLSTIESDRLATAIAVEISPHTGLAVICIAGHPPPLISSVGGTELIDLDPGLPLGLGDTGRVEHVLSLPPEARMILLTDGLVERRDEAITDSLTHLTERVAALPRSLSADDLLETLLSQAPHQTGDDAAVLVADVRLPAARPRVLVRTVPPVLRSAHDVRHWADVALRRFDLDDDVRTDVLAVISELVANGARAANTPVTVTVEHTGPCLRVGVRDDSHRRPRRRAASDADVDGRGLAIVDALAQRWWIEDHDTGGKTVWAEVSTLRPRGSALHPAS